VSKYEERVYLVGKKKPNIAELKNRLVRLRHDLEQFTARKPGGAVVAPLRERIVALEAEIVEAEANRARERQLSMGPADDDGPTPPGSGEGDASSLNRATSGRFPPRGRPTR
jgi:hypothetical protein